MMRIDIVCVGKIKEAFYRDAVKEYEKRLSRYCKVTILEVSDEKTKEGATDAENELVKKKEGQRILLKLKENAYVITMEIAGQKLSSEALALQIKGLADSGRSHIQFVIGGSLGLSAEVSARADEKWSFSDLTFPHQLMRVLLCEQLYRAYRILNCEPYHK